MAAFKPFNKISRRDFLRRQQRKRMSIAPTPPQESWVAQLDGVSQYWQLSQTIQLDSGDKACFRFGGGVVAGTFRRFIGSSSFSFGLSSGTTGQVFNEVNLSATMDGVDIASEQTPIPESGVHLIEVTISGSHELSQICAADSSRFMNLPLFDFKVIRNGVVIHEIPLTNKAQGATQLATVGNVNATMINYTEAVWKKESEL